MHTRLSRVIAAGTIATALLFVGAAPLPAAVPVAAAATAGAKATAGASRVTTANVNLRRGPGTSYGVIKVLRKGVRVSLAGRTRDGFTQVRNGGGTAWVSSRYLKARVTAKPAPRTAATPKGLKPNAAKTHRAAVAKFPRIASVHGVRAGSRSDHATGRAVDLMIPAYRSTSGKRLGGDVAAWARANARTLGISYVIWNQRIWSVGRSSEGWRSMANRGSDSANHKDHVHISVR